MSESTQEPEPENPEVKEGDVDEDEILTSEGTDAEAPGGNPLAYPAEDEVGED